MITVGVEEEYVLLDPVTHLPVALAEEVRAAAGLVSWVGEGEVQNELLQAQVEVATPVCTDLDEVAGHLLRLRHAVGSAAEEYGCRLASSAAAPCATRCRSRSPRSRGTSRCGTRPAGWSTSS